MKKILFIAAVFTVILVSVNYLGKVTLGNKPTVKEKELSKHLSTVSLNNYPKLKSDYEALNLNKKNVDILKVKKLKNEIKKAYEAERLDGKNGRSLAFYYLDLLLKLKSLNPKDKETILELGDISFERQVFKKASEYYLEYLNLKKKDFEVRGRLASAYSFLGEFDTAIFELEKILSENPKHFQALAYKAIALAQKNEIDSAISIGELALENAPTDEAFTRFGSYLEKLKNKKKASSLENYFRTNSVTKSKFIKIEEKQNEVKVFLKDFPFESMPEFAKEKFKQNVKKHARKNKKIIIVDITSSKELNLLKE